MHYICPIQCKKILIGKATYKLPIHVDLFKRRLIILLYSTSLCFSGPEIRVHQIFKRSAKRLKYRACCIFCRRSAVWFKDSLTRWSFYQPCTMNNNNEAGAETCSTDEQDEMVATERDLAEDAQWKRIQQNTFTRWANEHLKTVNKHIGNLETDLCDGLRLITLIEVLSGKRLPKHNKRPTFRSQKLENVSVALKFLEDDESIRIVNIGKYMTILILTFHAVLSWFPCCRALQATWSERWGRQSTKDWRSGAYFCRRFW